MRRTCLILAVLALSGCASLRSYSLPLPSLPKSSPAKQETIKTADLSPGETAKACITTAESLEGQGHYREAILLYEKARAIDPHLINYSRRLAALYDRAENAPAALREYQAAMKQAPRDADLLNDYAHFQLRQGDLGTSEQVFRECLALQSDHAHARSNLAVCLARQGRLDESYELFASVVGPAAAHYNLGVILAKQGEIEQSRFALLRARELNPDLEEAKVFLAAVERRTEQ